MNKEFNASLKKIAATIKTPEAAAKAVYDLLCEECRACGTDPVSEVYIKTPEECAKHGGGHCWYVSYEAGPYQWAIAASFILSGKHWYTEPNNSFDLCWEIA